MPTEYVLFVRTSRRARSAEHARIGGTREDFEWHVVSWGPGCGVISKWRGLGWKIVRLKREVAERRFARTTDRWGTPHILTPTEWDPFPPKVIRQEPKIIEPPKVKLVTKQKWHAPVVGDKRPWWQKELPQERAAIEGPFAGLDGLVSTQTVSTHASSGTLRGLDAQYFVIDDPVWPDPEQTRQVQLAVQRYINRALAGGYGMGFPPGVITRPV